jgi:anti-sigma regulatory factor (Ser/Thr protein kinase)
VAAAGGMAAGSPDTLRHHPLERPLPTARGDMWEIPFAADDLFELRQLITGWATREAMNTESTDELVLAVHEIATNSIRHGGGVGMLRMWRTSRSLICEIQDSGHMADPQAGSMLPGTSPTEGRGMWIANQLCDEVEVRSGERGTQVRMHKHLV